MRVNRTGYELCNYLRSLSEDGEKLVQRGADTAFIRQMIQTFRIAQEDLDLQVNLDTGGYGEWNINFNIPYNRMPGTVWGANDEFISAPQLDDLECAYASVCALKDLPDQGHVNVCCVFDNEEVAAAPSRAPIPPFSRTCWSASHTA